MSEMRSGVPAHGRKENLARRLVDICPDAFLLLSALLDRPFDEAGVSRLPCLPREPRLMRMNLDAGGNTPPSSITKDRTAPV